MTIIPSIACGLEILKKIDEAMGTHRRLERILGNWYFDLERSPQSLPELSRYFDGAFGQLTFERAEIGDEVLFLGQVRKITNATDAEIEIDNFKLPPWKVKLIKTFEITVDRIESRSKTFSVRAANQECAEGLALRAAADFDFRDALAKEPSYEVTNVR